MNGKNHRAGWENHPEAAEATRWGIPAIFPTRIRLLTSAATLRSVSSLAIFARTWRSALLVVGVVALVGCESARYQPTTGWPVAERPPSSKGPSPSEAEILSQAAAKPLAPATGADWQVLFDGRSLAGWRVTEFKQGGEVSIRNGLLFLAKGNPFVGVNGTNPIPTMNYEIVLDAMLVSGSDFFCGLTFPVRDSFCSFIVGGWGGSVVGLSNLDGADASENDTTQFVNFETGRWYRLRLRVTEQKIEAWIEQKKVVDVVTTGRKISLRIGDIQLSKPFGLAAYDTSAAFRDIKIREVKPGEVTEK